MNKIDKNKIIKKESEIKDNSKFKFFEVMHWVFLIWSIYQLTFCKGYSDVDYFRMFWLLFLVYSLDKLVDIYFKDEKENN